MDPKTEEGLSLATQIKQARLKVQLAQQELREILTSCPHFIVCDSCKTQSTEDSCPDDDFCHMGGRCVICNEDFGWYCPKSPDHICYYYSFEKDGKRYVELRNGQKIEYNNEHRQRRWESDDHCLFCGQPDERK